MATPEAVTARWKARLLVADAGCCIRPKRANRLDVKFVANPSVSVQQHWFYPYPALGRGDARYRRQLCLVPMSANGRTVWAPVVLGAIDGFEYGGDKARWKYFACN